MSTATLHLVVVSKRMFTQKEAAYYCGRQEKRFEVECPCSPIQFPNGDRRWDQRDLDVWLDNLKGTIHDVDLSRLG
jgi:hypothetical protein